MAELKYLTYDSIATALSTELNALAAAGITAASAAITNTNLNLYDDLELAVTFAVAPTANSSVEVYLIPSIDDTNYADSGTPARSLLVGAFLVQSVGTAQRLALRLIPIPPGLFKYVVKNNTNQAFTASGHTLKRRPYRLQAT